MALLLHKARPTLMLFLCILSLHPAGITTGVVVPWITVLLAAHGCWLPFKMPGRPAPALPVVFLTLTLCLPRMRPRALLLLVLVLLLSVCVFCLCVLFRFVCTQLLNVKLCVGCCGHLP